jgi:hypothetical protein
MPSVDQRHTSSSNAARRTSCGPISRAEEKLRNAETWGVYWILRCAGDFSLLTGHRSLLPPLNTLITGRVAEPDNRSALQYSVSLTSVLMFSFCLCLYLLIFVIPRALLWTKSFLSSAYSVVWVRERTIPTEQQPLVSEVNANFCG